LLQRTHLLADRRLRDAEPLRGSGERPPLDDLAERCQLSRVHKPHLYQRACGQSHTHDTGRLLTKSVSDTERSAGRQEPCSETRRSLCGVRHHSSVSVEIRDVAPGLWIWRQPHPDWSPEPGWAPLVTSTCGESGRAVTLL